MPRKSRRTLANIDTAQHATLVPSSSSPDKQSDACATCPKNAWGSDPKGGKGAPAPAAAQPPAGTRARFIQQPGLRVVRADPINDDFAHLDHAADEDEEDGEEAAP